PRTTPRSIRSSSRTFDLPLALEPISSVNASSEKAVFSKLLKSSRRRRVNMDVPLESRRRVAAEPATGTVDGHDAAAGCSPVGPRGPVRHPGARGVKNRAQELTGLLPDLL